MQTTQKKILDTTFPLFKINELQKQIVFIAFVLLCLTSVISPQIALLLGLVIANVFGNPFLSLNHRAVNILLQISVVGLGFGMNLQKAIAAGKEGFLFTVLSIVVTLIFGAFLGKLLEVDKKTAHLISCGTAICGGSAIAAISPIIKSNEKQTSVALGVIFMLNSVALFLFPAIGDVLNLSQKEFGFWCAIAIHDTSSVIGAANKFGSEALEIATTVKLARALWILPVALVTAFVFKNKYDSLKLPYFIGFFIITIFLNTYVAQMVTIAPFLVSLSKVGLTVTLFLIGSGLNFKVLKSIGYKPLLQGILLWICIAIVALLSILYFV